MTYITIPQDGGVGMNHAAEYSAALAAMSR